MKKQHHPILLATAIVGAAAAAVSAFVDWRKRHADTPPVVVVTLPGVQVKGDERELVERPASVVSAPLRWRAIGEP